MQAFAGKTAVISGGASGIGLQLARSFGASGARVVIADIDAAQLDIALASLRTDGVEAHAVQADVALREDWARVAEETLAHFGAVHILINNAGVSGGIGSVDTLDEAGWRWAIDVNLMGVVYGANTFVPLMRQHGEQAWLVNVASMAGMGGVPYAGAYTATKAAVVALSEAWAEELAGQNIHVSVLAPAFVRTDIHTSERNRQARYASATALNDDVRQVVAATSAAVNSGIEPEIVGRRVLEAMAAREFYIFTHPHYRKVTAKRAAMIATAFERAAESPHLADLGDDTILSFSTTKPS